MSYRIYGPTYVRKAGMWCVTIFRNGKQEQKWFLTEKAANIYYRKYIEK